MGISKQFLRTIPFYVFNFVSFTLLSVFFARWMGIEHYGAFAFAFHVIRIGTQIASIGISQASIKFLPRYLKDRDYSLFTGFFRTGLGINIILGFCLGFVLFAIMQPVIAGSHSHLTLRHAWWICPILGVNIYFSGILRSVGSARIAAASQGFIRDMLALAIAYLLWVDKNTFTSETAIIIFAVSLIPCIVVQICCQLFCISGDVRKSVPSYEMKRWTATSFPMVFSSLSVNIVVIGGIILLRLISDETSVAYYHTAWLLSAIVAIPVKAVLAIFSPLISQTYGKDAKRYQQAIHSGWQLLIRATVPICLILIFGGSYCLGWFGKSFTRAYALLVIIVFARAFHVAVLYLGRVLSISGYERYVARMLYLTLPVTIPMMVILGYLFGAHGIAVSYLMMTILHAVLLFMRLRSASSTDQAFS